MEREVDILVSSKDRVTELSLLMQTLRTQTHKRWNLYILDNASGTPIQNFHFFNVLVTRLRLEGHKVKITRNNLDFGICYARNMLNNIQMAEGLSPFTLRLDDDILPEPNYIEKLFEVIDAGYDIASGITPMCGTPEWKRELKFLNGEINKVRLNEKGEIQEFGDDAGYSYIEEEIIPAGHFRSCALYKSEINKIRYPDNLSKYGFREESFFSLKARMVGYKIGIHTGAKVFHIQTNSGGGRSHITSDTIQQDDTIFRKWIKKQFMNGALNGI